MSEKSKLLSRFFFYLITVSMFLLVLSISFLLQSGNTSFLPGSVFKLNLVNSTSLYFKGNVRGEHPELPFLPSEISQANFKIPLNGGESDCTGSISTKGVVSLGHKMMACDPTKADLRVYMYDLPPEFHFGLMGWKVKENQTWPSVDNPSRIPKYPGGLNLQHSMEYWLTLDLLSSNVPSILRPCTAIRVKNSSQADIIFVPFFSSLSYNRHSKLNVKEKVSVNKMLQDKLVHFLMERDEWKRLGGKDHLIVAHHPNSMLSARRKLGSSIFVLADFGRYPGQIANLEKDVVAPYRHVVTTIPSDKSPPFTKRPILLYFRGAIYRKDGGAIRQELYYLLKDEKDIEFAFGSIQGNGVRTAAQGMGLSKFCLNIAGDTPSSNRLFDAIASHCVPVIISDEIELPYEDVLDYSKFCVFVLASDAVRKGYLLNLLRGITEDEWTKMWTRLKEIVHHYEYQYPSQPGDAVNMIWEAVSRKRPSILLKHHKSSRYKRSRSASSLKW